MGNTTIVELNHDLCSDIEDNRDIFIEEILNQLRGNDHEGKFIKGGRVVVFFHRSDSPVYRAWNEFKEKFMRRVK